MTITCDTSIDEIIKVSDADSYISELESLMERIEKKVETTLDSEMSSNGLSKAAFHVDNESSLYNDATNLIGDLSLVSKVNSFKGEVTELIQKQREKEIKELKEKVQEKLNELKSELNETLSIIKEITSRVNPSADDSRAYIVKKDSLNDEITKYENKLRTLEGMK